MGEAHDPPPLTDARLTALLSRLALGGLSEGQRREMAAEVVGELRRRGSFDWNGVRHTAKADGTIGRALPW